MHRVELKGLRAGEGEEEGGWVPNAPCGVERGKEEFESFVKLEFLMHRVELKGSISSMSCPKYLSFLMHRVELKEEVKCSRAEGRTRS